MSSYAFACPCREFLYRKDCHHLGDKNIYSLNSGKYLNSVNFHAVIVDAVGILG